MFKFRKKIKYLLLPLAIISLIFIFYQLRMFAQLTSSTRLKLKASPVVFGIHEQRQSFYEPDEDNNFRCIHSMEVIDFSKINDDYCDCEDGTDEPGTNACPNGIFYCLTEENNRRKALPTHRINDGVCDCCDGSDEVQKRVLKFRLKDIVQEKLGKFMSPCKNRCKEIDGK